MEQTRQNSVGGHFAARAKLRIGFLLMHNFTLTAFATFVDVLRLAADRGDQSRQIECAWEVMSPNRRGARSSSGIEIQPSSDLIDPQAFDYVVVVGGLLHGSPPLAPGIGDYLRRAAAVGTPLVGVCTGSFVLCRLGLMNGRKCCVSWYHYRDFLEEFPHHIPVADRLFVIDGDRITCSGGTGVADLAAQLVSERLGWSTAYKALQILLVDHPRSDASAQPAPAMSIENDDDRVSRALLMMEQNLAERMTIAALAMSVGLSTRQLERVFRERLEVTPQDCYLTLRLRHAQWMLQHTTVSVATIAAELGFSDASHLGRCFKAKFEVTPMRFRALAGENSTAARPAEAFPGENTSRRIF
jgi:transcriptional regulator GlxA family with amidase domain